MESSGCGSRGEPLFDHQFLNSTKQCTRHFWAAFSCEKNDGEERQDPEEGKED
jgi:hypothetical protein